MFASSSNSNTYTRSQALKLGKKCKKCKRLVFKQGKITNLGKVRSLARG
jgi:hypothetical protein